MSAHESGERRYMNVGVYVSRENASTFAAAKELAKQEGISLAELIWKAVRKYLRSRKG